jgi:hypothetical protein
LALPWTQVVPLTLAVELHQLALVVFHVPDPSVGVGPAVEALHVHTAAEADSAAKTAAHKRPNAINITRCGFLTDIDIPI